MVALAFNLFMFINFMFISDVTKMNMLTVLWLNLFIISIELIIHKGGVNNE